MPSIRTAACAAALLLGATPAGAQTRQPPYAPPAPVAVTGAPTAATDASAGCRPGTVAIAPTALYQAVSCDAGAAVWTKLLSKPVRPQIIATRGRMAFALEGAGTGNYTRFESQAQVFNGARPATDLRTCFVNARAATAGEVYDTASDLSLLSAIYANSALTPMSFGGPLSPTLGVGGGVVCSDPVGIVLSPGQQFQVRSGAVVAAGQQVQVALPATAQSTAVDSTASTSQVYAGTSVTVPSGGATATYGFVPVAVIGTPDQNYPSACVWGDSIEWGYYDGGGDSTTGAYGFAERGLLAVNGYNVPYTNLSRVGDKTPSYMSASSWRRRSLLRYCSHVIANMGTNDLAASATDATLTIMKNNVLSLAAYVHQVGSKLIYVTMTPKTTSSDAWATAANQSVVAGYEGNGYVAGGSTGLRGAWNAWLAAQVAAGTLDGLIDTDAAVRDPTYPDKWRTNGTANAYTVDGLHPQPAAIALMAAAVNAKAVSFTTP